MHSKNLLNYVEDSVDKDALEATAFAYPGLFVDPNLNIVMLNKDRGFRVAIVSGSGSGHEPFPAGFVGEGMLTAAVTGKLFSSPSVANIIAMIEGVAKISRGGVLLLVQNYPKKILNFAAAMEVVKTKNYYIDSVNISDDVAQYGTDIKGLTGKRGMVGLMLAAKILGGFSKEGKSLGEIVTVGRCINCRLGSIGVALRPCTLPGSDIPSFQLDENIIDFGTGLHGEVGISAINITSLMDIVSKMLAKIMGCLILENKATVVAVVNNLGTMSQMEMILITGEVKRQLEKMKYNVSRIYSGTVMTSLDARGFQICLLNISGKEDWLRYLDEPTEAYAWPGKRISHVIERFPPRLAKIDVTESVKMIGGMVLNQNQSELFRKCLNCICKALMRHRDTLNALDSVAGDGDCGTTMYYFARGILKELNKLPATKVAQTLAIISKLAEEHMGGTSGAIFSLMLMGAAKDCETWESCWLAGIEMIQKYSLAKVGDRTMLDALVPACQAFVLHLKNKGDQSWPDALKVALHKGKKACKRTKTMNARAGRARYVDPSKVKKVDAGAFAIVVILTAIVKCLTHEETAVQAST